MSSPETGHDHPQGVALHETMVERDHAEMICLGCGGMAGQEVRMRARIGVPVAPRRWTLPRRRAGWG